MIIAAEEAGQRDLDLSDLEDLEELPVELGRLTSIKTLKLSNTRVSDLGIVSKLRHLTILEIDETEVSDLAPLRDLTALELISFVNTQVSDIDPLTDLHRLRVVFLDQTAVKDVRVLKGLSNLRSITLDETPVEDISPLSDCTRLEWLSVTYSSIRDLRPIRHLSSLIQDSELATGLAYFDTPATHLDPRLAELSVLEDDQERTQKTLDYLNEVADNWPPLPTEHPDQSDSMAVEIAEDGRADLVASFPTEAERQDRVKRKAHDRLITALTTLWQLAGNQHYRLAEQVRQYRVHADRDFDELDMLDLYFEHEALRGVCDRRGEREGEEAFGPDLVDALERVLQLGPSLFLDNPDVEAAEARAARYAAAPQPEIQPAQDALSGAIAGTPEAFGEGIRELSQLFHDHARHLERLQSGQRDQNRNAIIVVGGFVLSQMATAPLGEAGSALVGWFLANSDTILTLAAHYGTGFEAWVTPIMMRAKEAWAGAKALLGQG